MVPTEVDGQNHRHRLDGVGRNVNQNVFRRTAPVRREIDSHLLPAGLAAQGFPVEVEDLVAGALRWFGIPAVFILLEQPNEFFATLLPVSCRLHRLAVLYL